MLSFRGQALTRGPEESAPKRTIIYTERLEAGLETDGRRQTCPKLYCLHVGSQELELVLGGNESVSLDSSPLLAVIAMAMAEIAVQRLTTADGAGNLSWPMRSRLSRRLLRSTRFCRRDTRLRSRRLRIMSIGWRACRGEFLGRV
jgi:hypothetical protein